MCQFIRMASVDDWFHLVSFFGTKILVRIRIKMDQKRACNGSSEHACPYNVLWRVQPVLILWLFRIFIIFNGSRIQVISENEIIAVDLFAFYVHNTYVRCIHQRCTGRAIFSKYCQSKPNLDCNPNLILKNDNKENYKLHSKITIQILIDIDKNQKRFLCVYKASPIIHWNVFCF